MVLLSLYVHSKGCAGAPARMALMTDQNGHTVVLGGIGGDAHSVGLTLLRQALTQSGYEVIFLGTQTALEDFFRSALVANAVMISSQDGHATYYLRDFRELMNRYKSATTRWYLGGNLVLGSGVGGEERFLAMGFDRVFTKFVDLGTVLELLARDFYGIEPVLGRGLAQGGTHLQWPAKVDLYEAPLDLGLFESQRREVLATWSTGRKAAVLEENAEYLASRPSFAALQSKVLAGDLEPLIQPRSGVARVDDQIRLFELFKTAGIRVLSYQVDSLTRNNNYSGAQEGIRDSRRLRESTLNGFPVINHGVSELRRIAASVGLPIQTRHSTRDPRLLAEVSYAGGVTSFEGGAICYNIPYFKDYPVDQSIRCWQYVDRLTGLYWERFGIALDREFFGVLTATLIPPSLAIVVSLLEAILAVEQGVRSVSLGYAEQGHQIQDVAAIRTMASMGQGVLARLGYPRVQVSTVFHQYMAAFPANPQRARNLIFHSAATAALADATRILIKTPVEAIRIPSLEDNLEAIELVKLALATAGRLTPRDLERVREEEQVIRDEVEAILDSVIYCGGGNITLGIVKAFERGYLDIPFAPSLFTLGKVMTARDAEGAVRFLDCGNLQFGRELRQFHVDKMQQRRGSGGEGLKRQNYLFVEHDVLQVPREQYEAWPPYGRCDAVPTAAPPLVNSGPGADAS